MIEHRWNCIAGEQKYYSSNSKAIIRTYETTTFTSHINDFVIKVLQNFNLSVYASNGYDFTPRKMQGKYLPKADCCQTGSMFSLYIQWSQTFRGQALELTGY